MDVRLPKNTALPVVPAADQAVQQSPKRFNATIYTADPGSPSEEALRLLAVGGTQMIDAIT